MPVAVLRPDPLAAPRKPRSSAVQMTATADAVTADRALDDGALMARVKQGDEQAFADLVDRYKNPLVNYLTQMTRNRERAEDLAQDAFVRVYRTAGRYREQGQFQAFLFRIATNQLRTEARRAARWRSLLPALAAEHRLRAPAPSPQSTALGVEAVDAVTRALSRLPLHYRAPLVLREIEGWPYARIAATLGCREGTVKSRVHRGKNLLREDLSEYWNGGER